MRNLGTYAPNTWCPGCGNFAIMNAAKAVANILADEGFPLERIVFVSGIGCHAKIVDYINVNSFYSIHGRVVPVAGEGLEHLIFAAKRNIDITMIIHNNRVYGLTTGQYTPTSPLGFKGRSTPQGTKELPINPLELMLSSGATFLARGTSHGIDLLKKIFKDAIVHKGFSLVDVLQVCVTFYNMYEYYDKRVYELKDHDPYDYNQALNKIREWDYNRDARIALGVFHKRESPRFDEAISRVDKKEIDRAAKVRDVLSGMI